MSVKSGAVPDAAGFQEVRAVRREVAVATLENEGEKPPRVVMEGPIIIRCQPVMNTERTNWRLNPPTNYVRTIRQAQLLVELDVVREGTCEVPTSTKSAWRSTTLSYSRSAEATALCRFPFRWLQHMSPTAKKQHKIFWRNFADVLQTAAFLPPAG